MIVVSHFQKFILKSTSNSQDLCCNLVYSNQPNQPDSFNVASQRDFNLPFLITVKTENDTL